MESAAYWSPLGFFTSWRHLNLIVCQTGPSSHLNKHAKGEVEFVSPQLENVSLESLLVLSCKSFIGLKESGVRICLFRYFNDILYLELAVSQAQHSCPRPNASKRSPVVQNQNMSIYSPCASHPVSELQVMIGVRTLLGLLLNRLREREIRDQNMCNSV